MSSNREQIPLYAADGASLGLRSIEAAKRLIAGGHVKPAYGRKGHLKAIWLRQQEGGSPVETRARTVPEAAFFKTSATVAGAGRSAGSMHTTTACR